MNDMADSEALFELDLEYRLTIAIRLSSGDNCQCPQYFVNRRKVLMPAILEEARKRGENPADVFAEYARKIHARHDASKVVAHG